MELNELSKGDSGEQVKALQILLVGRGFPLPKYGTDGAYGDETVSAVKSFQKSKKIDQDGIAGKDTFQKLLGVS
jgi:N-acetylmuramoyl-L-alanine amidase